MTVDSKTTERASDHGAVISPTEARQGVMPHVTRYVLACGMALVVGAFVLVYLLLA